jgi:hexosaminidase
VAFPGLEVRYTLDGTDPTEESEVYSGPLEVGNTTVKIVTIDSRGRTSNPTTITLK